MKIISLILNTSNFIIGNNSTLYNYVVKSLTVIIFFKYYKKWHHNMMNSRMNQNI